MYRCAARVTRKRTLHGDAPKDHVSRRTENVRTTKRGQRMRESKSFVIPRGAPTCELVRPLEIRNVYKVRAPHSDQAEVPYSRTANAVKPRPSVADWQRKHDAHIDMLRRFWRGVKTVCCYVLGFVVLYVFMFLAALGG